MTSLPEDPGARTAAVSDAFRATIPTVYGYLVHRCGSRSVAEDLTQETFAAAVAALRAGTECATDSAWLVAVARNKLVDHYRRHGRESQLLHTMTQLSARPNLDDGAPHLLDEGTRAALLRLPDAQRLVLVLRYMDDLTVPETARLVGRSVHATESLLARGRERLRQLLREEDEIDG